jgi:hypothetical protein
MTIDPYEWTVRDPLEETVPDAVVRRKRLSDGWRRALEASALIVLAPGLLIAQWLDRGHDNDKAQPPEQVTVVPRGGTGTLGHLRIRLLGRDVTAPVKSATTPAGAVQLRLVIEVRPMDAQAAKVAQFVAYSVRDRAGHVWSASSLLPNSGSSTDDKPAPGVPLSATVTANVPERLVSSVVLEARQATMGMARGRPQVLRFAH